MSSGQQGEKHQEMTALRGPLRTRGGYFFRSTLTLVNGMDPYAGYLPAFLYTHHFGGVSVGGHPLTSSTSTRQHRQNGPQLMDPHFLNNPRSLTAGLEI